MGTANRANMARTEVLGNGKRNQADDEPVIETVNPKGTTKQPSSKRMVFPV